jgi:rare lipoprotein A
MTFSYLTLSRFVMIVAASLAASSVSFAESGLASYYGNESGTRTASGERFNENDMTCAHRSHPFGTRLRVTTKSASIVCRVNDRGPSKRLRGRIIDLSVGAARHLGILGRGLAEVTVEVIY